MSASPYIHYTPAVSPSLLRRSAKQGRKKFVSSHLSATTVQCLINNLERHGHLRTVFELDWAATAGEWGKKAERKDRGSNGGEKRYSCLGLINPYSLSHEY